MFPSSSLTITPQGFPLTKKLVISVFFADYWEKIEENEKLDKISGSCLKAEKVKEHEGYCDTNRSWSPLNSFKELEKETGETRGHRNNRDNSDDGNVKNSSDT